MTFKKIKHFQGIVWGSPSTSLSIEIMKMKKQLVADINIAVFWYESVIHMNDPVLVLGDVTRQFGNSKII